MRQKMQTTQLYCRKDTRPILRTIQETPRGGGLLVSHSPMRVMVLHNPHLVTRLNLITLLANPSR